MTLTQADAIRLAIRARQCLTLEEDHPLVNMTFGPPPKAVFVLRKVKPLSSKNCVNHHRPFVHDLEPSIF
jgi:hypothetical protein